MVVKGLNKLYSQPAKRDDGSGVADQMLRVVSSLTAHSIFCCKQNQMINIILVLTIIPQWTLATIRLKSNVRNARLAAWVVNTLQSVVILFLSLCVCLSVSLFLSFSLFISFSSHSLSLSLCLSLSLPPALSMPVCVPFVSSTSGIIFNPSTGAITHAANQQRT